jgi:L-lactate utilization protein LutC
VGAGAAVSARDRILQRIRRAAATADNGAGEAAADRLAQPGPRAPVPAQAAAEGAERLAQFEAKARATDATLTRLAGWEELPRALSEELRARNLPAAIRTGTDPAFERDWGSLERTVGPGRLSEPAALSRAALAMAETGTLVLESGPENPVTLTFLAETHFVALEAADIRAGFEDMWAEWRRRGSDPRTVNLVTGPSRSADIGQTLQLGAHGPVALHIFLIGG